MAESSSFSYLVLPDHEHGRVLVVHADAGWTLPCLEVQADSGWKIPHLGLPTATKADAIHELKERLGLEVTLFHSIDCNDPDRGSSFQLHTLENHTAGWEPPGGGRWIGREELDDLPFIRPVHRSVLASWFAEATGAGRSDALMPWWRPGWFDEAVRWTEAQLRGQGMTVSGPPKQVRSWYRSSVFRVGTSAGEVYFKASPAAFSHEAALTEWLAERQPARLPKLLAVDAARNWTLTLDAGSTLLLEVRDIDVWREALRAYAQLQIAAASRVQELLALGCLDLRLSRMALEVQDFFAELPTLLRGSSHALTEAERDALLAFVPRLRELCAQVTDCGVPCSLEHGDFHAPNVLITPTSPLYFDWQEGCVTHPFFSLASFLDDEAGLPPGSDVKALLQDAYFEPWRDYGSPDRRREFLNALRPLWLLYLAFQDRGQLATWWKQLGARPPSAYTGAEWSLRQRQYWLSDRLRRLLSCHIR